MQAGEGFIGTVARTLPAALAAIATYGCADGGDRGAGSSEAPPAASAEPARVASASVAAVDEAPKQVILRAEPAFPNELKRSGAVYQLDGHLIVVDGTRVLEVSGDKLTPIADAKGEGPYGGEVVVSWIGGKYPDAIDMIGYFSNGRAPTPHASSLTGKGDSAIFGLGGGYGHVAGVAYRDGSAVTMGEDMMERRTATLRGKPIALPQTGRLKVGCKAEQDRQGRFLPAVVPRTLGSSKDGTIISLGEHCGGGAGIEVWPRDGEAKVIELSGWKASAAYSAKILGGRDRAWLIGLADEPILELKDLKLRQLPKLSKHSTAFLGTDDTLYASDGATIQHLVGGDDAPRWQAVAALVWPTEFQSLTLHEGVFWGSASGTVFKLVPGVAIELGDGCKTPFVHLFDIKAATEPGYSFPTTKKALASFDRKKDIALLEFSEGNRRLGVRVPDRATGDAVIALIKANMKDEAPRLLCYEPTKVLRTHPL